MIEVDGKPVPRIIDFGLAKATTPLLGEDSLLTQGGPFMGTPGYISPEQADPGVEAGKHRDKLLDRVRAVIALNRAHPGKQFDGIHLDIEPQQRPENVRAE